jgi:hypothetical protein
VIAWPEGYARSLLAEGLEHLVDEALRGAAHPIDMAESERDGIDSILLSEGVHQRLRGDLRCSVNRDRLGVFSLDTQGARLAIRPIGHDR